MNAFNNFKQRHAKKSKTDNRNDNNQRNKRLKPNDNKQHYLTISSENHEVPCTPLTDDFENFMLSTEKKTKQRRKKFEFRSRQNKNRNKLTSINSLSPIPDIESSDISLSYSFNDGPPITPCPVPITPKNNKNHNMDISGISDISSIGNISPELPPSTPSVLCSIDTNKAKRYSPHSVLKSKPPKRYNDDNNEGLTVRMELIQLSPSKRKKYDTNKILSPVRRSKRIQKSNDENKQLKEMLRESNWTFKPNPLL